MRIAVGHFSATGRICDFLRRWRDTMYSKKHGLPVWEQYLIERFDLAHVAVAGRSGAIAMLYDRDADIGLHVEFDAGGAHLQLGGSSWNEQRTGSVRSVEITVGHDLSGRLGETIVDLQKRRMESVREIFDAGHANLFEAWMAHFGETTIRFDQRSTTNQSTSNAVEITIENR